MKKIFFLFFVSLTQLTIAQEKFTITGIVKDADSGETLIGVSIIKKNDNQGTITNAYAFYSLSLEKGAHEIEFSYLGYSSFIKNIELNQILGFSMKYIGRYQSSNSLQG